MWPIMGHGALFWARLSLLEPNHVLSVCKPVSRLLVKRILLVVLPWIRALNVSISLHPFIPLLFRFKDSLLESPSAWKEFYDSKNPHTQQLPDGWTHLGWVLLVLKQLFNWETILLSAQLQLSISYLGGRLRNIFANTKQAFSSHRLL